MKLAWFPNTRPDCLFEVSQLAQVTIVMFTSDSASVIRQLNRAVKYAVYNPHNASNIEARLGYPSRKRFLGLVFCQQS